MRYYLEVPYSQKDEAKARGALWDREKKKWYCADARLLPGLSRWFPRGDNAPEWVEEAWRMKTARPSVSRAASGSGRSAGGAYSRSRPDPSDQRPRWEPSAARSLSDEQKQLSDVVLRGENVLLSGCIGSGKTSFFQELTRRAGHRRFLYLTCNPVLKEEARARFPRRNVTVSTYQSLAISLLRNGTSSWDESETIRRVVTRGANVKDRWDVLLVDDYQELNEDRARLLRFLKDQSPGIQIVAMGDMDQQIRDNPNLDVRAFLPEFLGTYTTLSLTRSYRLGREQAARLGRIWQKRIEGCNRSFSVETLGLEETLEILKREDPGDILCLGPRNGSIRVALTRLEEECPEKFHRETVFSTIREGDFVRAPARIANAAVFTTYDNSKGLERRICALFNYTRSYWEKRREIGGLRYDTLRNLFCMAAGRAGERLIYVREEEPILGEDILGTPY